MLNFLERELQRLLGDDTTIHSLCFMGRVCIGTLKGDLRAKVEFAATTAAHEYDALDITILNRTNGPVDTLRIRFKDVWGIRPVPGNPNFPEGVVPHIWTYRGKTEWYAWKPTPADREQLREEIYRYLETFRPPIRKFGVPRLVYICAPLRGDVEQNIEFARQKAQEVFQSGDIPICPHLMFPPIADPSDLMQDQVSRDMGLRLLESCQQINVYGSELTEGMLAEIGHASKLGIPVSSEQQTRAPAKKHSVQKRRDAR